MSDVYVRLGYEFNIASRAFNAIGVDTADLGNVPDLLRTILEDTLSQEASPASLDRYLPRIRDIIINLLHGLKRKQQKLRQRQAREEEYSSVAPNMRHGSIASTASGDTSLTQTLENGAGRYSGSTAVGQSIGRSGSKDSHLSDDPTIPPRSSSVTTGTGSPMRHDSGASIGGKIRTAQGRDGREPPSNQRSQFSSPASPGVVAQNIHVVPPTLQGESMIGRSDQTREGAYPPPPPPLKQEDALTMLQKGGDLERRASRRYSAYQISKHLGASANGMPILPPAQHSPIPNRGRDVRESMNAVRVRASMLPGQHRSPNRPATDISAATQGDVSRRISEENAEGTAIPTIGGHDGSSTSVIRESPNTKKRDAKHEKASSKAAEQKLDGTVPSSTTEPSSKYDVDAVAGELKEVPTPAQQVRQELRDQPARSDNQLAEPHWSSDSRQIIPEQSPQPGKELTLFLQYKSKIKKIVLPEGSNELSIARLQLAFIEKFSWNTHSNGIDLPDIYIQDPVSGVRHELEDLSDVKDRSVLVLNVEVLDEVKRHIDDGLAGLGKKVEEVRHAVDGQQTTMQRVSERQTDAAKNLARIAAGPARSNIKTSFLEGLLPNGGHAQNKSVDKASQLSDIQSLRRDLAVMRQTYSSFVSDIDTSMAEIRAKAKSVKSVAVSSAIPALDSESGRAYVNKGKKELGEVSDALVNKVDDLQDIVEDLRKDVVTRGVRPLPRQLETVGRDIAVATSDLNKIQEFLRREKPKWSKIWEKELQVVCDDRDLLTMQEALAADLRDDLENAAQTFALVEEATKEQMKDGNAPTSRSASRSLNPVSVDPSVDPLAAKEGVLGEVRALRPNHEDRLEAIARAEKARQKELESRRGGEFQKELGSFVEEGRLKKSGGVEETERQRKAKDDRIRREAWEKQQGPGKGKESESPSSSGPTATQPEETQPEESLGKQPENTPPDEEGADTAEEHHKNGKSCIGSSTLLPAG